MLETIAPLAALPTMLTFFLAYLTVVAPGSFRDRRAFA
jgi:hypothetical protein